MAFTKFVPNTKIKSAEVNDNFAFISGNRLIAVNPNTGAAILDFPIGDLTAIATGSLAGDMLARSGKSIKVYNSSGVLIDSVTYDDLLTLQPATETQAGTAEIATQAETDAGTLDDKIVTPKKLLGIYNASTQGALGNIKQPVNVSGAFSENITKYGTSASVTNAGSLVITYAEAFPNATRNVMLTRNGVATTGDNIAFPGYTDNRTASGFTIYNDDADSTIKYDWQAIGD